MSQLQDKLKELSSQLETEKQVHQDQNTKLIADHESQIQDLKETASASLLTEQQKSTEQSHQLHQLEESVKSLTSEVQYLKKQNEDIGTQYAVKMASLSDEKATMETRLTQEEQLNTTRRQNAETLLLKIKGMIDTELESL